MIKRIHEMSSPFSKIIVGLITIYFTRVESQTCDVTDPNLTADFSLQTFTSVGYNGNTGSYIKDMDCTWLIDSGSDSLTILMILEYNTSCTGDRIFVYDGVNDTAPALTSISGVCGTSTSFLKLRTSQRYAYVRMVTDNVDEMAGFTMDYIAGEEMTHGACYAGSGITTTLLEFNTTEYQYITSPDFPQDYPRLRKCRWLLRNPVGRVDVEVMYADLEENFASNCIYDHVGFYDGEIICENNNMVKLCREYPGNPVENYTSSGSNLLLTFLSDGSDMRSGFLLRFRANNEIISTAPPSDCNCPTTVITPASTAVMRPEGFLILILILLLIIIMLIIVMAISKKKSNVPSQKTVSPIKEVQPVTPVITTNAARARKTLNYLRSIDLSNI